MQDLNKASKTGFCSDIKQTNIDNKRHHLFTIVKCMCWNISLVNKQYRSSETTLWHLRLSLQINTSISYYIFCLSKHYLERLLRDVFQVLAVLYNAGRSLSEKREVVSFKANWNSLLSKSPNKCIFYFLKSSISILNFKSYLFTRPC